MNHTSKRAGDFCGQPPNLVNECHIPGAYAFIRETLQLAGYLLDFNELGYQMKLGLIILSHLFIKSWTP